MRILAARAALLIWFQGALVGAVACGEGPPPGEAAVERDLRRMIAEVRRQDPDSARRLEARLGEAKRASVLERARPFWRRDAVDAKPLWQQVAAEAADAARRMESAQREAELRWSELAATAAAELDEARKLLGSPGIRRQEAAAVARAASRLELARRRAASGDFEEACRLAEEGRELSRIPLDRWRLVLARFEDRAERELWRRWVNETIGESRAAGGIALVVDKLRHRLHLYAAGRTAAALEVELGANGLLPKVHAGDAATPEGKYRVVAKKQGKETAFYLALLLDYPNRDDWEAFRRARQRGVVPAASGPGGLIEIHGGGGQGRDWTDGCVALTDQDMQLVFEQTPVGAPVTIVGTL